MQRKEGVRKAREEKRVAKQREVEKKEKAKVMKKKESSSSDSSCDDEEEKGNRVGNREENKGMFADTSEDEDTDLKKWR